MEPGARREQGKFVVSRSTSSFAGCAGYRHTVVLRPTIGRFHEGTPNTPPMPLSAHGLVTYGDTRQKQLYGIFHFKLRVYSRLANGLDKSV